MNKTLIASLLGGLATLAMAQPGSAACIDAQSNLDVALAAVLELDPAFLGEIDTPGELTLSGLNILSSQIDFETPAGLEQARVVSAASLATFDRDQACAGTTPTTTVAPPTTVLELPDERPDTDNVIPNTSRGVDTGDGSTL